MTTPTNANEEWEKELDEILKQVESDFQMGGLSSGLYADYAIEVAKRAVESYKSELIKDIEGMKMETKYTEDFPNDPHAGFTVRQLRNKQVGYNPALEDIISLINNK